MKINNVIFVIPLRECVLLMKLSAYLQSHTLASEEEDQRRFLFQMDSVVEKSQKPSFRQAHSKLQAALLLQNWHGIFKPTNGFFSAYYDFQVHPH